MRALGVVIIAAFTTAGPGLAHASALSDLAAAMNEGTWAELSTDPIAILGQGAHSGNVLPYAQSALWDPVEQTLHYVGSDHNFPYTYFVYSAEQDAWAELGTMPMSSSHAYDHLSLDVIGRRVFVREYGIGDARSIFMGPMGDPDNFVVHTEFPPAYAQVAIATAYLPGVGLAVYNCGEPGGQLAILDEATDAWTADIRGFGGDSTYHCFAEYSEQLGVLIFGGGNANPRSLFRLDGNTVTVLPEPPVDLGVQRGNVTADPNSGHFLVLGYGQFYAFDPMGQGTWSLLEGDAVPPSFITSPGAPELQGMVSGAITDHGVNIYLACQTSECRAFLYRHQPGSGIPSPTTGAGGSTSSAGAGGATTATSGSGGSPSSGNGAPGADHPADNATGCACHTTQPTTDPHWACLLLAVLWLRRRPR
jgi:MYXO-CTERM domain-containing protein